MEREILFRGKRSDNGEWVIGSLIKMGPAGYVHHFILPDYASAFYDIEVQPGTVGQYTGLTDKNGVKIFEGDIVQAPFWQSTKSGLTMRGIIEFHKSAFSILWEYQDYGRSFVAYIRDMEVIGNIRDNPELLSKDEKPC